MDSEVEFCVSVIIPCFNRRKTLLASVFSVLALRNEVDKLEVIVVDDGSTDGCLDLLAGVDVKIFSTGGRRGACYARNVGVENALYDWVAFNDSDDLWLPGKLANSVCAIRLNPSCDWLFHRFSRFDSKSGFNVSPRVSDKNLERALVLKNYVSTQCLMVKKSVLLGVGGFDEALPRFQDWDLALRLSTYNYIFMDDVYVVCIEQADSISKNFRNGIVAREHMLSKYPSVFKAYALYALVFKFNIFSRRLFFFFKNKFFYDL